MHYFYTTPTSIFLHKVSLLVVLSAFVGAPTSGRLFFVFTSYSCTLYKIEGKGLAVIQQRFDSETKSTWWSEVDPWITDALYLHPDFREYFEMRAGTCTDGIYPTVTVRQIMWALKMKPIQKERWETVFDRRDI